MIGALSLIAAVLGAAGPCDPGEALPRDVAAAEAYRAVAEEDQRRGELDSARRALREALRRDPENTRVRASWTQLCAPAAQEAVTRGLRQMKAGDCRGAIDAFTEARRAGDEGTAALMQGLCHYELGEDGPARTALQTAARSPPNADVASLYLGLIALREGQADVATAAFRSAQGSRDPALSEVARTLARSSRGASRLALSVGIDAGHDSNAFLASNHGPGPANQGVPDQPVVLSASAVLRPLGRTGPYAHVTALYRNLLQSEELDVLRGEAAAGWHWGSGSSFLLAEAAFARMQLAEDPYENVVRASAVGAHSWGEVGVLASYSARWEEFLGKDFEDYSGIRHEVRVMGQWWLGTVGLAAGYRLDVATTWVPGNGSRDHGPRAELRLGAGGPRRLTLSGGFAWRAFGEVRDRFLDGMLAAELDVMEPWTLRFALIGEQAFSVNAVPGYSRWAATLGLIGTFAPW